MKKGRAQVSHIQGNQLLHRETLHQFPGSTGRFPERLPAPSGIYMEDDPFGYEQGDFRLPRRAPFDRNGTGQQFEGPPTGMYDQDIKDFERYHHQDRGSQGTWNQMQPNQRYPHQNRDLPGAYNQAPEAQGFQIQGRGPDPYYGNQRVNGNPGPGDDGWESVDNFATAEGNYGEDYDWNSALLPEYQQPQAPQPDTPTPDIMNMLQQLLDAHNSMLVDFIKEIDASHDSNTSLEKESRMDNRGRWLLCQKLREKKMLVACRNDIHWYDASFIAVYKSLIPAEEELEKQRQLMAQLENLVAKEWPHAELYLYGSCANSFGFSKSDIDVCLAIEDDHINKTEMLLKLADILESDNLQNVQALTLARVPIVKLMDPVTGISCDICINNELARVNTKLLGDYARIDVRLRQLAFIVKHWAKSRRVNETFKGTLSSYAYVLMCIHFLQQRWPPILPCLQEMEPTFSYQVDDIQFSYFDNVDILDNFGSSNWETIAELVWGFFNYWAYAHDYLNTVVSVRTRSILGKQEKDWTRRVGNDRHLICIEDPVDTNHDLGRVVNSFSIRVLREEFERAAEIMQQDPNPCAKLFEPYLPGDNNGQGHY